jgi:hypothetical protein
MLRGTLKRSFHSRFKLAHSCQKKPNLHTNSLNKLCTINFVFYNVNYIAYRKNKSNKSIFLNENKNIVSFFTADIVYYKSIMLSYLSLY